MADVAYLHEIIEAADEEVARRQGCCVLGSHPRAAELEV